MKSYVVMADNREKIICVSDDLRHDMLLGACWEDFDMEIIEVERV